MLNFDADYQFVRLEKAFISKNTSAIELAKNADSIYYKNADVRLIRNRNGVLTEKQLEKVSGETIGYPREDGIFATSPNILYRIAKTDLELKPGDVVKLLINTGEGETITSETTIIDKTNSSSPSPGREFDFSATQSTQVKWSPLMLNGGVIYTSEFILNITEVKAGVATVKNLKFRLITNTDDESYRIPVNGFYTFLANSLEKDKDVKRFFNYIDYYLYTGDKNFADFNLVSQANNGITSSGEFPIFTNLSKGYGVFGSKSITSILGIGVTSKTIEELRNNSLTKDLNFQ
jgi:hypothetical protein